MPAQNLREFIGWLKANPDKASEGNPGAGSPGHVGGVLFQSMTGTRFQFVPYRGAAPAMQDLVAGRIDMMIDNPVTSLPHVRSGSIKAFAVTAKTRLPQAPEILTVDEAGLPGFSLSNWGALGPEGHAEERNRQAECCCRGRIGRSCGPSADCRSRHGNCAARAANAGRASRHSQS